MKKIFKYSVLVSLCTALVSLTGCQEKELDVDPLGDSFTFSGMAPNPVMRGGELRVFGRGLDKVTEVRFAGDVSVTEFVDIFQGSKLDTLVLVVPVEGPEVGKVVLVNKNGEQKTSLSDLSFTEPIEVESFTPATVLSGDVLTLKGEYLNVVKEVIFSGEDAVAVAFESQSRHELKVKVPANAISGPVIVSDVNEIEDQNTIPNHIYTKTDLTVGKPTVTKAAKATYKSGDVITVKGDHLDMIQNVALPQVAEVAFEVAEDTKSLKFNLPPKASDGNITLTSFAGDAFDAGEIETVSVTELTVVSLADDSRFKAGCQVEITGSDLDLVTKVAFENAEADWYLDKNKIIATQPDAAKDGAVVVTLESGKQAYSADIEVVKPVVTAVDITDVVAGKDAVKVSGTDLDLVTSAVIGTKEKSFIECPFELKNEDSEYLAVTIPENAYSAPITLAAASGYTAVTDNINVTYDMAVSISFDAPSYGLGSNITITGKKLLRIEQIFIKGKKVTDFAVRADNAMSFGIPDKIGPGVYRLDLLLTDGTEMTWPVPFEITAPFTETYIWEGSEDLAAWGNQPYLGADGGFADAGLEVGDLVRIYFTTYEEDWQFQIFSGHWDAMTFPELDGGNTVNADNCDASNGFFSFEVTEDNYALLTTVGGWGGALLTQGQGVIITGLSMIHFGAAESKNVIWEGSVTVDWSGTISGAEGAMSALSWGGYDWSTVSEGTILALSFDRVLDDVQIRVSNGSWAALPGTDDPYKPEGTELRVELTQAMIDELVSAGGLVITGQGFTLTEIALVTGGAPVNFGTTIWEGSVTIDWSGTLAGAEGSMSALSWGGYDWASVEAGTILRLEYTLVDGYADAQVRLGNGSWAALPDTLDPYNIDGTTELEVEITENTLGGLVNDGGLVITGQFFTLTAVILK